MMDPLSKFDSWAINCIEKRFTHPWQRWTGLNNFDLMPWSLLFFFVVTFLSGVIFADFFACFVGGLFLLLHLLCLFLTHISGAKDLVMRAVEKGCANPMKIDMEKINARSGLLLTTLLTGMLTPLAGFNVASSSTLFVACLGIYFQLLLTACDTLPPAKSKFREFLESLASQPKLVPIRVRK
jgi:hypothetical protein